MNHITYYIEIISVKQGFLNCSIRTSVKSKINIGEDPIKCK